MTSVEEEFRAAIEAERKDDQEAAAMFIAACESGDVDKLRYVVDRLNQTVDGWRLAMLKARRMRSATDDIQRAFLDVWIQSVTLPRKVGNRRALADALRVLLPISDTHISKRLYRGADGREYRYRTFGFSWTSDVSVALGFADHWKKSRFGGVVLSAEAPPEAVLYNREADTHYPEKEIILDPFKLARVEIHEQLPPVL